MCNISLLKQPLVKMFPNCEKIQHMVDGGHQDGSTLSQFLPEAGLGQSEDPHGHHLPYTGQDKGVTEIFPCTENRWCSSVSLTHSSLRVGEPLAFWPSHITERNNWWGYCQLQTALGRPAVGEQTLYIGGERCYQRIKGAHRGFNGLHRAETVRLDK